MNVKVCRNCLQTLTPERRERGLSTCANCAKTLQALKDKENPPVDNPLQAALKSQKMKELEEEALKKEVEKKQKNVESFFVDFSKVKKTFW